jgi:hypothetical protein
LLWPAGKRRLRGTKARRSRPGFPTGLPRCGEVWALREDSIGCEAYTRSEVIPVCAASEVRYQGYLLCLRDPVEGALAGAAPDMSEHKTDKFRQTIYPHEAQELRQREHAR